MTYDEIVKDFIGEDITLIPSEHNLIKSINSEDKMFFERLRTSKLYKIALDKFLKEFNEKVVSNKDFEIKGYSVLSRNIIKEIYDSVDNELLDYSIISKKIERASLLIGKYIDDHKEEIFSKVREQYNKKIVDMDRNFIQKERKKIEEIEKELRNKCNQSLKKYCVGTSTKISKLYFWGTS